MFESQSIPSLVTRRHAARCRVRALRGGAAMMCVLLASPAVAAVPTPGERAAIERRKRVAEVEARQEIESLFTRLCPGRCELISVNAVVATPQPVGEVTPGFESPGSAVFEAELKRVEAKIMLDSKLPRTFQSNIPAMLRYRLSAISPNVIITPIRLEFPSPQHAPMPPMLREAPRRPQPAPQPQPAPKEEPKVEEPKKEEPKPEVKKEPKVEEKPWYRELWAELLPWIPFVLMLLVFFALFMTMLRRMKELLEDAQRTPEPVVADGGEGPEMPDVEALRQQLRQSRRVQNDVLRRWIVEDGESVALLVQLVGPEVLADLKADRGLRPALEVVSEAIAAQSGPVSAEDAQRVAREARARITAARVLQEEQGLSAEWEFVQGLTVGNLQRVMGTLSAQEKSYAIGQLPGALRASYLDQMDAGERRELFLNAGSGESLSKEDAIDLSSRLRKASEELTHISAEAGGQAAIIVEMLVALPLAEQEDTLRALRARRPEVAEAVLAQIFLETAIPHAPRELVADAMYRTPLDVLVRFVSNAREDVRAFLMDVAPGSVARPLQDELSLEVPVTHAEYMEARDAFNETLSGMLRRNGADLAALNARAISGQRAPTPEVSA